MVLTHHAEGDRCGVVTVAQGELRAGAGVEGDVAGAHIGLRAGAESQDLGAGVLGHGRDQWVVGVEDRDTGGVGQLSSRLPPDGSNPVRGP